MRFRRLSTNKIVNHVSYRALHIFPQHSKWTWDWTLRLAGIGIVWGLGFDGFKLPKGYFENSTREIRNMNLLIISYLLELHN